jgi:hypothetical protein
MWKELPATITAQSNQAEVPRFVKLLGEDLAVKPGNHYIHRVRAPAQHGPAIARPVKALLDLQGFGRVVVREFHLQGRIAPLVVSDADGVVNVRQENLSVANLPRLRRFKNGLNGLFGEVVRDYDLNFDLGKQINLILISTVKLGVSLLPAVPAHFEDCHAFHADIMEGILDRIKS